MFFTFDFQLQTAPAALTFVKVSTIQLVLRELFLRINYGFCFVFVCS